MVGKNTDVNKSAIKKAYWNLQALIDIAQTADKYWENYFMGVEDPNDYLITENDESFLEVGRKIDQAIDAIQDYTHLRARHYRASARKSSQNVKKGSLMGYGDDERIIKSIQEVGTKYDEYTRSGASNTQGINTALTNVRNSLKELSGRLILLDDELNKGIERRDRIVSTMKSKSFNEMVQSIRKSNNGMTKEPVGVNGGWADGKFTAQLDGNQSITLSIPSSLVNPQFSVYKGSAPFTNKMGITNTMNAELTYDSQTGDIGGWVQWGSNPSKPYVPYGVHLKMKDLKKFINEFKQFLNEYSREI